MIRDSLGRLSWLLCFLFSFASWFDWLQGFNMILFSTFFFFFSILICCAFGFHHLEWPLVSFADLLFVCCNAVDSRALPLAVNPFRCPVIFLISDLYCFSSERSVMCTLSWPLVWLYISPSWMSSLSFFNVQTMSDSKPWVLWSSSLWKNC